MTAPDLRALVEGATTILAEAGVPSPRHDATALAAHVLGLDRLEWSFHRRCRTVRGAVRWAGRAAAEP